MGALLIGFSLLCSCLIQSSFQRRPRSWNLEDLTRSQDQTQWLQDSAGFAFHISTKNISDMVAVYSRLKNEIRHIIDVDPEVLIVESDEANAFVAQRVHKSVICITVPMLIFLGSDLHLHAALLSHQLAHLAWKHDQDAGMGTVFLHALWLDFIIPDTPASIVAPLGMAAINGSYNQEQDRETDRLAVEIMVAARIDPNAAIEFHERLRRYPAGASSFRETHRASDERIRSIKQIIEANQSRR